jgi:hypothetical protein
MAIIAGDLICDPCCRALGATVYNKGRYTRCKACGTLTFCYRIEDTRAMRAAPSPQQKAERGRGLSASARRRPQCQRAPRARRPRAASSGRQRRRP